GFAKRDSRSPRRAAPWRLPYPFLGLLLAVFGRRCRGFKPPGSCRSPPPSRTFSRMIRKLKSGEYRLYSRKKDPRTGKRKNLGTFKTLAAAKRHERAVQFFKRG